MTSIIKLTTVIQDSKNKGKLGIRNKLFETILVPNSY